MKSLNRFLTESSEPEIINILHEISGWFIKKASPFNVTVGGRKATVYKVDNFFSSGISNEGIDTNIYIYIWSSEKISFVINNRFIDLDDETSEDLENSRYASEYSDTYIRNKFMAIDGAGLLDELSQNLFDYLTNHGRADEKLLKKFELI